MQRAIGSEVFGLASLVWPGPGEGIELAGLALEGGTVSLTAYGDIEGLTFDGYTEVSAPDLSAFSDLAGRQLGGSALATARGQVNPLTGALDFASDLVTTDLTVDIPEADALLDGQSRIALSLVRDLEGTRLRSLSLTTRAVEASMQGELQPGFVDLSARMTTDDLSQMGDGYGGHLAVDVRLQTDGDGQRLRFDGSAIDLRVANLPAADVIGGLLNGANRLRGDLYFENGRTDVALLTLDGPRIAVSGAGIWAAEDPDLRIDLSRMDLAALSDDGSGVVTGNLHLTGAGAGQQRITASFSGDGPLRSGIAQIDGLLTDGARLVAQATLDENGGLRIENADISTTGLTMTARGTQDAAGNTRITAQAQIADVGRVVTGLQGAVQLDLGVERHIGTTGYDIQAALTGPSSLSVSTRGRIEDDFTLALDLSGRVQAAIMNPLIEPSNVRGMIAFNGSLNGPPSIDSLRLTARATDGHFV